MVVGIVLSEPFRGRARFASGFGAYQTRRCCLELAAGTEITAADCDIAAAAIVGGPLGRLAAIVASAHPASASVADFAFGSEKGLHMDHSPWDSSDSSTIANNGSPMHLGHRCQPGSGY